MSNMKENRNTTSPRWNFDYIAHGRKLRRNRRRSGVALLVAITTLAMLTVIVSEVSYVSRMRFLTAYHQILYPENLKNLFNLLEFLF